MKCALCGYCFKECEAKSSCRSCIMKKGCTLMRCPNCGYEIPKIPGWMEKLFKGRRKNKHDK